MFRARLLTFALLGCMYSPAWAATFGKVVRIGGHVSDLALDEAHGRVYVANFTANKIQAISTSDLTIAKWNYVRSQPATIALSPSRQYLVVGHYASWTEPALEAEPGISIMDPESLSEIRFVAMAKDDSPLAVAFGGGDHALVVSKTGFSLLDPSTGTFQPLQPLAIDSQGLCVPFATFPPQILQASVGVSGDSRYIIGVATVAEQTYAIFRYEVQTQDLVILSVTAEPALGPQAVSVDEFGRNFLLGWALLNDGSVAKQSLVGQSIILMAQFPYATGALNIGGHAYDWARRLIYAQIPEDNNEASQAPVLHVVDSDNLTVRERIQLPENLAGKSVLNRDHSVMYAASDSGLLALPVGELYRAPRISASSEDMLFRGSFCDRRIMTQEIDILDAGGGPIDFKLSTSMAGVTVTPSTGTTPARVKVTVDPNVYQDFKGTTAGTVQIISKTAINIPAPIRLLINAREPDQRGALFNVPGKLVDILSDPVRNRFYVLRQDRNQVLVFDTSSYQQVAVLRTGNTPTQIAMTYDYRYLLVANDNSQIANVYDLDTYQPQAPIIFPPGHYPRSIGVSRNATLVASRLVEGDDRIDRVNYDSMMAEELPCLGIYCNNLPLGTTLAASPSRETIFIAMEDGNVLLYEAQGDTFIASRKDFESLGGALAALSDQTFSVDNHLLNWSLVAYGSLDTAIESSSGFTILDGLGLRTGAGSISGPGAIQRVGLDNWDTETRAPAKLIEAPLLVGNMATLPVGQIGQTYLPFTRTLAIPASRSTILSLSVSGFMAVPMNFDAALEKPVLRSVVNLADGTAALASGTLMSVLGTNLGTVTLANSELPVPTILGEACLTVNDMTAPLLLVSPGQINAQMPFEITGTAKMVLWTAGGVSDPFSVNVSGVAPAVFRTASAGPMSGLTAIYRAVNNEPVTPTNPIHPGDYLVIYATGLGKTSPTVETGAAAPADPLAQSLVTPAVTLGGLSLPVTYSGLVPGLVGVYQINVFVLGEVPIGREVPLVIARPSGDLTFTVRVVN